MSCTDAGDGYYHWTSPPLADGASETFKIIATDVNRAVSSTAAELSVEMVTLPTDATEAEFTYNGDLTVTIT